MKKYNFLLAMLCVAANSLAADLYVSASQTATDADRSKGKPYARLHQAIAAAQPGDVIHLAEGKYLPLEDADDARYSFFTIDKDLTLIGGYDAAFAENDPESYETILSGDMDGDDSYNRQTGICSNNEGNSYHVLYVNDGVALTLRGVTVQGGNADLNNVEGKPKTQSGGGIFTDEGTLTLEDVLIKGNASAGKAAAGIYAGNGFTGTRLTFMGNVTGNDGGGLFVKKGKVVLTDCTFMENTANSGGGALMIQGDADGSYLANNTFYYNTTARYGTVALYSIAAEATITIVNNTFVNNIISNETNKNLGGGGAVYARGDETVQVYLVNNTIMGNITQDGEDEGEGGAVYNRGVTFHLANNIIAGNYCAVTGNDLYTESGKYHSLGYNLFSYDDESAVAATPEGNTGQDLFAGTSKEAAFDALAGIFEGAVTAFVFEPELSDNGGNTETVRMTTASSLIACLPETQLSEAVLGIDVDNDGEKTGTLATDQRGVQRNLDGRACIGAYEYTDEGSFLPGIAPDGSMVQLAGKQLLVNAPADYTCTVYDLQGKPHLTGAHAAHDHVIDIAHLPQGAYIVRIDTPARHEALKIIL